MSRKSSAYADGTPSFRWRLEKIEAGEGAADGRFKCTCTSQPRIFGFGDSEQKAILAARHAMETAVDKAETTSASPGTASHQPPAAAPTLVAPTTPLA